MFQMYYRKSRDNKSEIEKSHLVGQNIYPLHVLPRISTVVSKFLLVLTVIAVQVSVVLPQPFQGFLLDLAQVLIKLAERPMQEKTSFFESA